MVYLDEVLALNFTADYLLLLVSARLIGEPLRRRRFAFAAFFGALYAALLYLPGFSWLGLWWMKLLSALTMVYIAYGKRERLLRQWLLFCLVSCGFAGVEMALACCVAVSFSLPLFLASFLLGYLLLGVSFRGSGRSAVRGLLIPVTLEWGGKRMTLTALLDSGCALSDPLGGEAVLVVSEAALEIFWRGEPPNMTEYFPFETISGTGLLRGFRCDMLVVGKKRIPQGVVAVYEGRFNGNHQALWGGETEGSGADGCAGLAERMGKRKGLAATVPGFLYRRQRHPAPAAQPGGGRGTAGKAS